MGHAIQEATPCSSQSVPFPKPMTHHHLIRVIHKRIPVRYQLSRKFLYPPKPIAGMDDLIPFDTQHLQITLKGSFEFLFFLVGVGIIETKDHFPVILVSEITVEEEGFKMTDVKVTGWFGSCKYRYSVVSRKEHDKAIMRLIREIHRLTKSNNNLAIHCIRQISIHSPALVLLRLLRFSLSGDEREFYQS